MQRKRQILRILAWLAAGVCMTPVTWAQRWERLGPPGGQVLSLAVARDGTVYLGTPDGHVFASQDQAASWELRGRAGGRLDAVVQTLVADARDARRLYAGVWYLGAAAGGGVFRSDDGGRNWSPAGLAGESVRALEQSALQPEFLVAGTRSGVFRTEDGGARWERISPRGDAELRNVDSVAIDPENLKVLYVGTYHLPWKTTDGGKTWAAIHSGMIDDSDVMSMRIDRENPARVFASACSGIYRSGDAGASWIKLQGIPYSSRRTQQILQDPVDARVLYAATTEGLWISRDIGESWVRMTPRDWAINAIAAIPSASGVRVLIGTEDRGVLAGEDSGKTFHAANKGFSHRVVSALAGDPREPGHLLVQVEGSPEELLETRDEGGSWAVLPGKLPAAGIERLFGGESAWWAALRGGGAARYNEKVGRWLRLRFVATAAEAPRRSNRKKAIRELATTKEPEVVRVVEKEGRAYLVTSAGVWEGDSGGKVFRAYEPKGLKELVMDFVPGEKDCALLQRQIACSQDGSGNWTRVDGPSAGEALWVQAFPGRGDAVFAGTNRGAFRLEGLSKDPWRLLQSGLPAIKSNGFVASGGYLGAAMGNGGFYVSGDGGKSWKREDLPNVTGGMSGVIADGRGGFVIGSQTEGVLRWVAEKAQE
jgi:photosystem II stability/assembly factor-like uncharacterized protein